MAVLERQERLGFRDAGLTMRTLGLRERAEMKALALVAARTAPYGVGFTERESTFWQAYTISNTH